MPNETDTIIVSCSVEEDKGTSGVVQEVFAAENCSAECPTCQQSCALTAGHARLHHFENGDDWGLFPLHLMRRVCCPLQQVTHEAGSLVLPSFFSSPDTKTLST